MYISIYTHTYIYIYMYMHFIWWGVFQQSGNMSDGDAVPKLGMGFQEKQSGTKNFYSETNSHPTKQGF